MACTIQVESWSGIIHVRIHVINMVQHLPSLQQGFRPQQLSSGAWGGIFRGDFLWVQRVASSRLILYKLSGC